MKRTNLYSLVRTSAKSKNKRIQLLQQYPDILDVKNWLLPFTLKDKLEESGDRLISKYLGSIALERFNYQSDCFIRDIRDFLKFEESDDEIASIFRRGRSIPNALKVYKYHPSNVEQIPEVIDLYKKLINYLEKLPIHQHYLNRTRQDKRHPIYGDHYSLQEVKPKQELVDTLKNFIYKGVGYYPVINGFGATSTLIRFFTEGPYDNQRRYNRDQRIQNQGNDLVYLGD